MNLLDCIAVSLDVASAICAIIVISLFLLIRKHNQSSVNRVTLRLQLGIALLDFFNHTTEYLPDTYAELPCSINAFFGVLMYHIYMCFNISIALNLNLAILCSKKPNWKWERYYWAVSLLLPLFLDVPLLVFGIFGRNAGGICSFKDGSLNETFKLLYYAVFSSLTILYCFTISVAVVYKVRSNMCTSTMESLNNPPELTKGKTSLLSLKSLIRRTCLYPISCFLTYFVANVGISYKYLTGNLPTFIDYWGFFGTNSRGILHLMAFLADPYISKEMAAVCKSMSSDSNPSKIVFYQFESSSDGNYSYNHLAGSFEINDIPPCYTNMIRELQKYL